MAENELITFRLPADLRVRAEKRIKGQYSTMSEYLRDLIRKEDQRIETAAKRKTKRK